MGVDVLKKHSPKPWALKASTALCEVFCDEHLEDVQCLYALVTQHLVAAKEVLHRESTSAGSRELIRAVFDLLAVVTRFPASLAAECDVWARFGAEELPR